MNNITLDLIQRWKSPLEMDLYYTFGNNTYCFYLKQGTIHGRKTNFVIRTINEELFHRTIRTNYKS